MISINTHLQEQTGEEKKPFYEHVVISFYFATSAIIWNSLIYICMNKQVRKKENRIPVNN